MTTGIHGGVDGRLRASRNAGEEYKEAAQNANHFPAGVCARVGVPAAISQGPSGHAQSLSSDRYTQIAGMLHDCKFHPGPEKHWAL